jgi:hypothetical protein
MKSFVHLALSVGKSKAVLVDGLTRSLHHMTTARFEIAPRYDCVTNFVVEMEMESKTMLTALLVLFVCLFVCLFICLHW